MIVFLFFLLLVVVGIFGIVYGLWALSEDSRARRKVYEEDVETAAELLTWLHQNREKQPTMAMPRKRPVVRTRRSTTL